MILRYFYKARNDRPDDAFKSEKKGTYSSMTVVGVCIANSSATVAELVMSNVKLAKNITSVSYDRYETNLYKWDGTTLFSYNGTSSSRVTIAISYYYNTFEKYISIKVTGSYSAHQIGWIGASFTNLVLS